MEWWFADLGYVASATAPNREGWRSQAVISRAGLCGDFWRQMESPGE